MSREVTLTSGYEIDLEDQEGFEHLFNAIIGDVTTRLQGSEDFSEGGFGIVHAVCLWELHFVAGQLHHMGSQIDIAMLVDEFGVQWDRVAEKLNSGKSDDDASCEREYCITKILCNRRLQRGNDCEQWILDGEVETGEVKCGIGSLLVVYESNGRFTAQGMVEKEHSLAFSEDQLLSFLETTLENLGIEMDRGGVIRFMSSDYYVDVGY